VRATVGIAIMFGLVALGQAQITPAEQPIQAALEALRGRAGVQLTMTGTETLGAANTTFQVDAFWFQAVEDGRPMSKVELRGWVNGVSTFRIVGDGTTLWAHDLGRNLYSADRYGNYSGAQPLDYLARLFASLGTVTRGRTAYPGRLLAETYAGEQARYRTWLPGAAIESNSSVVRYTLGNPERRRIEFYYTGSNLNRVDFYDATPIGEAVREISWSMTVTPFDVALSEPAFQFVPPAGARPVVGLRPVTG
jgi:hypothetical protein